MCFRFRGYSKSIRFLGLSGVDCLVLSAPGPSFPCVQVVHVGMCVGGEAATPGLEIFPP